eukprot:TRINITY_DN715_c0_g1_i1.p1 TRINITY_DN715_c0_g1~~TRINITY_DN715_c0_g1_i1.p1  ORF type:complete len:506 (+),score=124.82 TRINITY_DN715_c0_g1_i1:59-1519(+)
MTCVSSSGVPVAPTLPAGTWGAFPWLASAPLAQALSPTCWPTPPDVADQSVPKPPAVPPKSSAAPPKSPTKAQQRQRPPGEGRSRTSRRRRAAALQRKLAAEAAEAEAAGRKPAGADGDQDESSVTAHEWAQDNESDLRGTERSEAELLRVITEWWKRAMNHGWVAEWVDTVMTDDVVLIDHVPAPRSIRVSGKKGLCLYYNKILQMHFPGNPEVTWDLKDVQVIAPGNVRAQHDICATWSSAVGGVKTVRSQELSLGEEGTFSYSMSVLYDYRLRGHKIAHVVMRPTQVENTGSQRRRLETLHEWQTQPEGEAIFKPELWRQYLRGAGGVQLIRPCKHNDWDNVRIKRGWIILRCRACHAQWRQRPCAEHRCTQFNSPEGCARGADCELLHVHHFKQTLQQRQQHAKSILPTDVAAASEADSTDCEDGKSASPRTDESFGLSSDSPPSVADHSAGLRAAAGLGPLLQLSDTSSVCTREVCGALSP